MRLMSILLSVALITAACAGTTDPGDTSDTTAPQDGTVAGMLVASDVERSDPSASSASMEALSGALTDLALGIYHELADDGNLVFSPVSIHTALSMAYAGAAGSTATEMEAVLAGELAAPAFHEAVNSLDQMLESRNRAATEAEGEVRLNIANSLWGQDGMEFATDFLDLLASEYGSGMRVVDFIGATEEARLAINRWVAERTNYRIEELLAAGVLDELVRLVLVNAVYLNAAWQTPFDERATSAGPFTRLDFSEVPVPKMRAELTIPYASGNGWRAIRLPYAGNELGMLIVLPDPGEFVDFESDFSPISISAIRGGLSSTPVVVALPKFEVRTQAGLVPVLQRLGLSEATSDRADFSGMTGAKDLFISDVVHEAWISADEAGTEAAAATAVNMSLTAAPTDPVIFDVDRPFIFVLEDVSTGAILFMGRVVDPTVTG